MDRFIPLTREEEAREEFIDRMREKHDITYRVEAVVDDEVIRTIESNDFEILTSYQNEEQLEHAIDEYMEDMHSDE